MRRSDGAPLSLLLLSLLLLPLKFSDARSAVFYSLLSEPISKFDATDQLPGSYGDHMEGTYRSIRKIEQDAKILSSTSLLARITNLELSLFPEALS